MAFHNDEFERNKKIRKLLTKNAEEFDGLVGHLVSQNQKMANHIHSLECFIRAKDEEKDEIIELSRQQNKLERESNK